MKATEEKNHPTERPRSLARVLIISGLYAALMGGGAYLTYQLLINPARERALPAVPKRTELPSRASSLARVLATAAPTISAGAANAA